MRAVEDVGLRNTLRPRTCSADLAALKEVGELAIARVLSYFLPSDDDVENLQIDECAACQHQQCSRRGADAPMLDGWTGLPWDRQRAPDEKSWSR